MPRIPAPFVSSSVPSMSHNKSERFMSAVQRLLLPGGARTARSAASIVIDPAVDGGLAAGAEAAEPPDELEATVVLDCAPVTRVRIDEPRGPGSALELRADAPGDAAEDGLVERVEEKENV